MSCLVRLYRKLMPSAVLVAGLLALCYRSAQAAPGPGYPTAKLLGQSYDSIVASYPSCVSGPVQGPFYTLQCRSIILGEPCDMSFKLGTNRQVVTISYAFVPSFSRERATAMYNEVCRVMRPQFATVSEERTDSMVRRVFASPGRAVGAASFAPLNASGGQITADIAVSGGL